MGDEPKLIHVHKAGDLLMHNIPVMMFCLATLKNENDFELNSLKYLLGVFYVWFKSKL